MEKPGARNLRSRLLTEHERKVIQRFLQNHEKNSLIRSLHRYAKKYVIQDESDLKLMKQFIVEYVRAEK
jgi:predicted GIY-YIG superfamily endonuclease